MLVDLADGPLVEAFADAPRAVRVAREQDERRVIALLGAKVDLRHRV
jgi:hypothetical protein